MIDTMSIVKRLAGAGIQLQLQQGKLITRAEKGAITRELAALIKDSKAALLEFLQARAELNTTRTPAVSVATPAQREQLSHAQRRLWLIDRLMQGTSAYNMPTAIRIEGRLDQHALERAFNAILERHAVLRTVYYEHEGQLRSRVLPDARIMIEAIDLGALEGEAQHAELLRRIGSESQRRFDLAREPSLRAALLHLSAASAVLLVNMHHIAADGWSVGVLVREFEHFYTAFSQGRPSTLAPLTLQYADYAAWQHQWLESNLDRQLQYWREQLQDLPQQHALRLDYPRPRVPTHCGEVLHANIPADVSRQLALLCQERGATLFMALQLLFAVLLARCSGSNDIVVGTPIAGRTRPELEELIGMFVNTLVLRTRVDAARTFDTALQEAIRTTTAAYQNQHVPFDVLVETLRPQRTVAESPLVQIMFVMQNTARVRIDLDGLALSSIELPYVTAKLDLTLNVAATEAGLVTSWEFNTDVFARSTIERLAQHYVRLISSCVAQPHLPLGELQMLDAAEREQLLHGFNATQAEYPQVCLHELFEAQVRRTPQAIALEYQSQQLSFAALDARANQLAHYLRAQGVGPDTRVGLCVERSLEMVIGILGILKAGGAYAPLDPSYPTQRLAYMLEDCAPAVLLLQSSVQGMLPWQGKSLCLDTQWDEVAQYPSSTLSPAQLGLTLEHLAYVIYTSGSTGKPKGVMNHHRGLVNRLWWAQQEYQVGPADRLLQKTPFSFDVSVWELLLPMLSGARLVMARPGGHLDPQYLSEVLQERQITMVHFVPSMLEVFLEQPLPAGGYPALKRILCSGEALPHALQVRCQERLPAVELHNLYGPTEAAIDVTAWHCVADSYPGRVPIGRPIANTQIYILDGSGEPVPVGVVGELYLGGVGVARGYLNRAELTQQRFIPDPFSPDPQARLYKTGDVGRWLPEGVIEYLGRNDDQVKIRGFRIELGEIEQQLRQSPAVQAAAVIAQASGSGDQQLVAYVVLHPEQLAARSEAQWLEELRQGLQARLPQYMVPSGFMVLPALPLNPSGKLDRRALPRVQAGAEGVHVPPTTPTEQALVQIWAQLLKREEHQVSAHASFFELGGHSLLAVRLIAQIRTQLSVELSIHQVFELPRLVDLARRIDEKQVMLQLRAARKQAGVVARGWL
jgi:amino acid adenylation domain-containing protein